MKRGEFFKTILGISVAAPILPPLLSDIHYEPEIENINDYSLRDLLELCIYEDNEGKPHLRVAVKDGYYFE